MISDQFHNLLTILHITDLINEEYLVNIKFYKYLLYKYILYKYVYIIRIYIIYKYIKLSIYKLDKICNKTLLLPNFLVP